MRIHLYSQFYPVADGAGNRKLTLLMEALAKRGHQIEIISDDYELTDGVSPKEEFSIGSGYIKVSRLHTTKNMKASLTNRLKTYGFYASRALTFGLTLPPPDLVFASIQPLFSGLSALAIAKRYKVPYLLEIRDLWPDDLIARHLLTNFQGLPLTAMANTLYWDSTHIVSVTPGIKRELVKKGLPSEKIDVFPVGCDFDLFDRVTEANMREIRTHYGWGDDIVAIYPGTHTEATALDVAVRAAAQLQDIPNFRMVFFGEGQCKESLMALAKELDLKNVEFHSLVSKSEVAKLIKTVDIALLNLQPSPLAHIFFENKFMDYMAAAKPMFGSMDGEQASIINTERLGQVVASNDPHGLARVLRQAIMEPEKLREMGRRAYQYGQKYLDMNRLLTCYCNRIEEIAAGKRVNKAFDPFA